MDFIWVFNVNKQHFVYASYAIKRITGHDSATVLTLPLQDFVVPQFLGDIQRKMQEATRQLQEDPTAEVISHNEIKLFRVDGSTVWIEYELNYMINEEGEVEAVGISRNIEERKRKEREINFLSTHDYLTKVHNRSYLYAQAQREMARTDRSGSPLALLFIDLDGFKSVNDHHGHVMGDAVLQKTTQAVARNLRKSDVLARYGGEEFVILMPDTALSAARNAAERIRRAVETEPMPMNIAMTASVGMAVRKPGETLDAWINRADQAMYKAKEQGRNRCIASEDITP